MLLRKRAVKVHKTLCAIFPKISINLHKFGRFCMLELMRKNNKKQNDSIKMGSYSQQRQTLMKCVRVNLNELKVASFLILKQL